MKEIKKSYILILMLNVLLLGSCTNEIEETFTIKINEPIFMPMKEFRSSVKVTSPKKTIEKQGKIAFYKDYLYISEPEKGIHIINNSNPSKPNVVGFIEVIGNVDIAIKDNILYADSYIDMVWFDIINPAAPKLLGRKEDVFPTALPATGNVYGYDYNEIKNRQNGIVIGWNLTTKTEKQMTENKWWLFGSKNESSDLTSNSTNSSIGKTGSMSRFSIYQKYLYTVKEDHLGVFDIGGVNPQKVIDDIYIGWNVETIFSYKKNIFIGTPTGMIIFSVKEPLKPELVSSIQHVYGCDPVVVENDIAYVTVHSGNNCGQNNNELIIINVKDVYNPQVIVSYHMTKPRGLTIENNILFVCDDGIKIFNAENPTTIMAEENFLAHFKDIEGYDLIASDGILMMIAEEGIYQFDYSDLNNIKQLSFIPIRE